MRKMDLEPFVCSSAVGSLLPPQRCICIIRILLLVYRHTNIVNISVFNALSISSGLVAAVLLCIKRGRYSSD